MEGIGVFIEIFLCKVNLGLNLIHNTGTGSIAVDFPLYWDSYYIITFHPVYFWDTCNM